MLQPAHFSSLSPTLQEQILEKLGFKQPPSLDLPGLEQLYTAWCQHVPFDSVHKRIYLHTRKTGVLPDMQATHYYQCWLSQGTGGTCWPSCEAWYTLLQNLGFDAYRLVGAMLDYPQIAAPNHATVMVKLEDEIYITDCFWRSEIPLPLREAPTCVEKYPSLQLHAEMTPTGRVIWWRFPLGRTWMRYGQTSDYQDIDAHFYQARYALTGGDNSAFNHWTYITRNYGTQIHSVYKQTYYILYPDNTIESKPFETIVERNQILIENFNLSEAIVAQLPACASV